MRRIKNTVYDHLKAVHNAFPIVLTNVSISERFFNSTQFCSPEMCYTATNNNNEIKRERTRNKGYKKEKREEKKQ